MRAMIYWDYFLETCGKISCGVTNIRLELKTEKSHQKGGELNSLFRWDPDIACTYRMSRVNR